MPTKSINLAINFFAGQRSTRYLESAFILLMPIIIWAIYGFSPFNNNDGFLDPWIYFGYIHNFQDLVDRYGLPYYSVRFGLIFPHIVFGAIFGALIGHVVFVYSMYLLAGVPLYLCFRKHFSVHAAVLAYAVLVSSVWFARTALWTHPDAAAVPYLVAATALVFLEPRYRRMGNITVGILIAMAANSNIFALSIGGLIAVAYLSYHKDTLWVSLRRDVPWMIAGFLLVCVFGMAAYYLCCGTMNYLGVTLDMMKWSVSGSGHIYHITMATLLSFGYIYLPPFLLCSMAIVSVRAGLIKQSIYVATMGYLCAASVFYVWYDLSTKTAILGLFYYFSFLFVPSIFCMVLVPVILAKLSDSPDRSLILAVVSFLLPPLLFAYGVVNLSSIPTYVILSGLASALALILAATKSRKVIPYAIVSFGLATHLIWTSNLVLGQPIYAKMFGVESERGLSRYRLGVKFIEAMPKFQEDGRTIHFWYSNSDKLAHSLQSTYLWGYSRVFDSTKETIGLPSLRGTNLDIVRIQEKSTLVLFDRDTRKVNQGIEELRRTGIPFEIKKTQEICELSVCYTIVVLDVSGTRPHKIKQEWREGKGHRLGVALDWSQTGAGKSLERDGAIVSIVTPPKAWNYGAVASMVFSEQPLTEHGVIRLLVSVSGGRAGLGFTGRNISNFIKRLEVMPRDKPQELFFEIDNLGNLHNFVVQTWDRDKSAKVSVLEFELALQGQPERQVSP